MIAAVPTTRAHAHADPRMTRTTARRTDPPATDAWGWYLPSGGGVPVPGMPRQAGGSVADRGVGGHRRVAGQVAERVQPDLQQRRAEAPDDGVNDHRGDAPAQQQVPWW